VAKRVTSVNGRHRFGSTNIDYGKFTELLHERRRLAGIPLGRVTAKRVLFTKATTTVRACRI